MKKYALHPGWILSRHDGDDHFISAGRLAELYGVRMQECVVVDYDRPQRTAGLDLDSLEHLFPAHDYRRRDR